MLLRNFINMMSLRSNKYTKYTSGDTNNKPAYSTSLTSYGCNNYGTNYMSSTSYRTIGALAIALGSGTTAPTIDDTTMGNPITTLTDVSHTCSSTIESSYLTQHLVTLTQTVKNETENSVTITEIGVFGCYSVNVTMFTRDIISPVTIGVGETKTFVVTIDLDQLSTSVQAN